MNSQRLFINKARWIFLITTVLGTSGWLFLANISSSPTDHGVLKWTLGVLTFQWTLVLAVVFRNVRANWRHWIIVGVWFRFIGLAATPILEDDHHRFLWDGRMFFISGNPYATSPSDHFDDSELTDEFADILDQINYPEVPTLYGPATEFCFLLSYVIEPGSLWPWKAILLAADILLIVVLQYSRSEETGKKAAVFAAWCPLSIYETAFNAHPDGLAVSLMTLALLMHLQKRIRWLGAIGGLAVATKVFAVLIIPFLLIKSTCKSWLYFVLALLACYVPFWIQGSAADLEGLKEFTSGWEFNSSVFALLSWGIGPQKARVISLILFGVGWTLLIQKWAIAQRQALPPGLAIYGLFFIFSPTFNSWYALWFLPFVALSPSYLGIAVMSLVSLSYITRQNLGEAALDGFAHPAWVRPLEFGLIGVIAVIGLLKRKNSKSAPLEEIQS